MSVDFYGQTESGRMIAIDYGHPCHINMANGNAVPFLAFLGFEYQSPPIPLPEARRAVIRARATFDAHVDEFTRESSDTKHPGKVRVIVMGIDRNYFKRRLEQFAEFIEHVAKLGAASIYWG